MNRLIAEAAPLDNRLLATDEEEYDKIAHHVVGLFDKASDLANASLDNLDPSIQTIPFFFVLNAQIEASTSSGKSVGRSLPPSVLPEGLLWPHITRLLLQFDPIQVRYVGRIFTKVIEIVARGGEQTQNPIPAIQLLGNAIIRLDPTSSTLTTTHFQYIRLCLLAGAFGDAAAVLDHPICSIPAPDGNKQLGNRAFKHLCSVHDSSSVYLTPYTGLTQKITSRIYLEYFLMGGMCYMATGQYEKALLFLETVLVAPTVQHVASTIMVEAYKKWLLVSLLLNGADAPLPKATSPNVVKIIRALGKPYECLVDAFKSKKPERLQAEIQEGLDIWQGDANYGLVHEVLMSFRKFAILRLGKTYAALTVEEVARCLSPESPDVQGTLTDVQTLIATAQLNAELVPSTSGGAGTLRFGTGHQSKLSEIEVEAQLAGRTRELQILMKQISNYDHQLNISKDYIDWLQKLKVARDKEKKSGAGAGNRPAGVDMQDEDMMDDL